MWFSNKIVVGVLKREVNDDASEAAILKCIKLGEDTESPKLGEETESPTIGEETKSPKLGKDTESPKMGEETGSPKLGEDTKSPTMGEETESPRMGEDTGSPKLVSSKWLTYVQTEDRDRIQWGKIDNPSLIPKLAADLPG